jgi:hypothetical protein
MACGSDDDTGTPPPQVERIDGTAWGLEAEYGNTQLGITCSFGGTISFTQSGDNLTGGQIAGQETCSGPTGTEGNLVSQPLTGGEITESGRVTFRTSGEGVTCEFAGQFAEDEFGQAIEGDMECSAASPLTGTFSAQR